MIVHVPVSLGELVDKLTILEIKSERIGDPAKLLNVETERALLQAVLDGFGLSGLAPLQAELRAINEDLWRVEDDIRLREKAGLFDEAFVALARRVYVTNDRRAEVKKRINVMFGSDLVEEKSYA